MKRLYYSIFITIILNVSSLQRWKKILIKLREQSFLKGRRRIIDISDIAAHEYFMSAVDYYLAWTPEESQFSC